MCGIECTEDVWWWLQECELVKVVGIKYVIKPPRVVSLRLACTLPPPSDGASPPASAPAARTLTVRYHDMPDVIDFLGELLLVRSIWDSWDCTVSQRFERAPEGFLLRRVLGVRIPHGITICVIHKVSF